MELDREKVGRGIFTGIRPLKSQGGYKAEFFVPEAMIDQFVSDLGGHPQSGESRWCVIAKIPESV